MVPFALLEKTRGSWVEVPVLIWVIAFSLLKVSSTAHAVFCFPPFLTPMCCGALHFQAAAMLWLRRDQGSKKPHVSQPFCPGTQQTAQPSCICRVLGVCFKKRGGKETSLCWVPTAPGEGFAEELLSRCVCVQGSGMPIAVHHSLC